MLLRPSSTRSCLVATLLAICVVLLAACGDDGGSSSRTDREAAPPTEAGSGSSAAGDGAATDPGDEAASTAGRDDATTPSARAVAVGRRLDRLVAAYAPVSGRVSYVVAAETLRVDLGDARDDPDTEAERAGVVRLEIERGLPLLARARALLLRQPLATPAERRIVALLLRSIDARASALRGLQSSLDAVASEGGPRDVGDLERTRRALSWREQWETSVGAARHAMTATQDARERIGLEPASEVSFR